MAGSRKSDCPSPAPDKKRSPRRPPYAGPGLRPQVRVSDEILDAAFDWIASGRTLSDFCRKPNTPDRRSIVRAIERGGPALAERFMQAREHGFDVLAEETLRLVDEPIPTDDKGRADPGIVQQRRLQADVRLRLLSKWCTARYGDKLRVDGGSGLNVMVVTGVVRNDASPSRLQVTLDDEIESLLS